jgi:glutathione peroxidase-family protein
MQIIISLLFTILTTLLIHGNEGMKLVSKGLAPPTEFYTLHMVDINGKEFLFENVKGKVVLITNVASECGYTNSNYEGFKDLLDEFPFQLAIVAFPSNEFEQENGNASEIKQQVQLFDLEHGKKNFYLMSKSNVNGKNQNQIFQTLRKFVNKPKENVGWNFEAKFLISHDGSRISWYKGTDSPLLLIDDIKILIRQMEQQQQQPQQKMEL